MTSLSFDEEQIDDVEKENKDMSVPKEEEDDEDDKLLVLGRSQYSVLEIGEGDNNLRASIFESRWWHILNYRLTVNLVPDDWHTLRISGQPVRLIENVEAVRLLKFSFLTLVSILTFHPFVRWMGGDWGNDKNYQLSDFFLYDFNSVALDTILFFIVGRVYKKIGFDRLIPCIIPLVIGIIFPSWAEAELSFLRYSFSTYEIVCAWPWQLFVYCLFVAGLTITVIVWHVKGFIREGTLIMHLLEILGTFMVFILPIMSHPNFHLHHWYLARLVGMHLNLSDSFSQGAQAFFWGQYINGVAAWGRDPVLTCAYSYYISTDIDCAFMDCYFDTNATEYKPFIEPDWHNCSASYIP